MERNRDHGYYKSNPLTPFFLYFLSKREIRKIMPFPTLPFIFGQYVSYFLPFPSPPPTFYYILSNPLRHSIPTHTKNEFSFLPTLPFSFLQKSVQFTAH